MRVFNSINEWHIGHRLRSGISARRVPGRRHNPTFLARTGGALRGARGRKARRRSVTARCGWQGQVRSDPSPTALPRGWSGCCPSWIAIGTPLAGTGEVTRPGSACGCSQFVFLRRLRALIGKYVLALGVAGHAQRPCNKHRATPINPQFPTAEAPAGYGRPNGSCHVRRPIPGSRYARQRATLVDVLRVALNACKCCESCHWRAHNHLDKPAGSHCEAPRWLWQTNWVLLDRRAPPWRLAWPMAGYIGRCASCGSKCCASHHRRAHNHLDKPAGSHCAGPLLVMADQMGPARPAGTSVAAFMANGGLHRPLRFMRP